MTHPKQSSLVLEAHQIKRKRVQQSLAIAAVLALVITSCSGNNSTSTSGRATSSQGGANQNSNDSVDAVFYENTEQCEADIKKQEQEYNVLLTAEQNGELQQKPTPPILKVEDCAAQILAAKQEHERTAPLYGNEQDCRAEGVQCESVSHSSGYRYRPIYGGSYFYPYHSPSYVYVNYGGSRRRVYETRPVYASNTPGQVVTPFGQSVSKSTTGRVKAPRHTTVKAPKRPAGTSGRGTISGRSRKGFGSTYKSTGRGGK